MIHIANGLQRIVRARKLSIDDLTRRIFPLSNNGTGRNSCDQLGRLIHCSIYVGERYVVFVVLVPEVAIGTLRKIMARTRYLLIVERSMEQLWLDFPIN